jgi:hypothetical protein
MAKLNTETKKYPFFKEKSLVGSTFWSTATTIKENPIYSVLAARQ